MNRILLSVLLAILTHQVIDASSCGDRVTESYITCKSNYDDDIRNHEGNYCCIAAKFSYCFDSKTYKDCEDDPIAHSLIDLAKSLISKTLEKQNCGSQGKYPSAACLFFFYQTWFIVAGGVTVGAAIGAVIGCVVVKRRRRISIITRH